MRREEKRRRRASVCWELFPATPADLYCRQQSMVRSVAAQSAVAAPHRTDPSLSRRSSPESLLVFNDRLMWFLLYPSHYKCITVSVLFRGDIDMRMHKSRYLLLFYIRIIKTDLTQTYFTKIRISTLFWKQF